MPWLVPVIDRAILLQLALLSVTIIGLQKCIHGNQAVHTQHTVFR
jgi:hypothetical protein